MALSGMLPAAQFVFLMVVMISGISGVQYDKNYIPKKWNGVVYKNGMFDYDKLREMCNRDDDFDQSCTPDRSGYVYCDWRHNGIKWNYKLKTHKCDPGWHCGKCWEDGYWPYEGKCKCTDATKPPSFPSTGRITWTGHTQYYGSWGEGWGEKKPIKGVIQVTEDGMYLFKSVNSDSTTVTIIVPNGDGSFTEYKGDGHGRQCKRTTTDTDNRKSLTWLWVYFSRDSIHTYELKERTQRGQKWGLYHDDDWEEMSSSANHRKWWMTINLKDENGKVGTPQKFYMEDATDDDYDYTHAGFKYTDTDTFEISDYCR